VLLVDTRKRLKHFCMPCMHMGLENEAFPSSADPEITIMMLLIDWDCGSSTSITKS
jgi:hypothetical protein